MGKDEYLERISSFIELPTLCKDFIIDPLQIYKAKLLGASCVLLIVAVLSDEQLIEFISIAHSIGLDALVEIHNKEELDRVIGTDARIIGINNRNLKTFKTDLSVTLELTKYIPEGKVIISESGIHTKKDIEQLKNVKINGILVGESFMKSKILSSMQRS